MDQLKGPITRYNQQQSPLLSLPGEIRNIIYKYALGGKTIQFECRGSERRTEKRFSRIEQAAIRHTCKQSRSEIGLYLAYSVNTFGCCDICLFFSVSDALQPGLQYIRSVELQPLDYRMGKGDIRRLGVLRGQRSLNHVVIVMPETITEEVRKAYLVKIRQALEKDRQVGQAVKITVKDVSGEN